MKTFVHAITVALLLATRVSSEEWYADYGSYLSGITLFNERSTLDFDLLYTYSGVNDLFHEGERQMYVLGFLEKDEVRIRELAADETLKDENQNDGKFLFEILLEEKLVVVLETKTAEPRQLKPEERQTRLMLQSPHTFSFSFKNNDLVTDLGKLKNFDATKLNEWDQVEDRFKLLIFVPKSNNKHSTKLSTRKYEGIRHWKAGALYFKPLPYRFTFRLLKDEGLHLIYVD